MPKKAFVSGCFDMLHSGHVAFFEEAAQYGDLYVAIGSDRNVYRLKQRPTINSEDERLYMIQALACVKAGFVAKGSGILDFVKELEEIRPDYFVVNEDGSTPAKQQLCQELGIAYVVLKRVPHAGLAVRSTTALRSTSLIPDYLVLAGGGLEQPAVSGLVPGPALTLSIQPWPEWCSPSRSAALELWNARLPVDKPEKLAKILFGYTNLPGSLPGQGANPALGICLPGLTRADYAGNYWPERITNLPDEDNLRFIEENLQLLPLEKQSAGAQDLPGYSTAQAGALAQAAQACWQAIQAQDAQALGESLNASLLAQPSILATAGHLPELLDGFRGQILGWNICNLGSTSGLLLVSKQALPGTRRINLRRASD